MCYATQEESAFVCMLSPYAVIRCDIRYVPFYVIRQLQAKFKWKWNSTTKILPFCMQSRISFLSHFLPILFIAIYIYIFRIIISVKLIFYSLFMNSIQTKKREINFFRKIFNLYRLLVSADLYRVVFVEF